MLIGLLVYMRSTLLAIPRRTNGMRTKWILWKDSIFNIFSSNTLELGKEEKEADRSKVDVWCINSSSTIFLKAIDDKQIGVLYTDRYLYWSNQNNRYASGLRERARFLIQYDCMILGVAFKKAFSKFIINSQYHTTSIKISL